MCAQFNVKLINSWWFVCPHGVNVLVGDTVVHENAYFIVHQYSAGADNLIDGIAGADAENIVSFEVSKWFLMSFTERSDKDATHSNMIAFVVPIEKYFLGLLTIIK